jgi:hypothetical protein
MADRQTPDVEIDGRPAGKSELVEIYLAQARIERNAKGNRPQLYDQPHSKRLLVIEEGQDSHAFISHSEPPRGSAGWLEPSLIVFGQAAARPASR